MENAVPSKPQGGPPFLQSRMPSGSMWVLHNSLRVSSPWLIKINPAQQREGFLQLPPTLVKAATTPNTMSGSDIYPLRGPSDSPWRVFPLFFQTEIHNLRMGKLRHKNVNCFAQDHMNTEWQGQDSASSTDPKPVFYPQHLNSSSGATGWLENISRMLYL